jgi:uncharacterized protein YbaA (DUF1428 family)
MPYVDGYVIPVKNANKEAYRAMAAMAAPVFIDHGALHVVENWGDDVPRGKTTDFWMAVKAEEGECVVFSWITWPSKEARDAGNAAAMADERLRDIGGMDLFDGKRIVFSGFQTIVEAKA